MPTTQSQLISVAQAEDTQNLLDHIAWTDVIKPRLANLRDQYSKALVNHLLGLPLPDGLTKEQLAGRIYGIDSITTLFEQILRQGKKALEAMQLDGFSLDR